jgi:hypothetical protein
MRSQITFVMHPDDEANFIGFVSAEPGTAFVDGPNWSAPQPPIVTNIERASRYLMIWNPSETPKLKGAHHRKDDVEWWYCENEFLTIQLLRSGFQCDKPYLLEGRIAIQTTKLHEPSAPAIETRFKRLRNFIKKSFTNNVIIWQNTEAPRSRTNPIKPRASQWVGPFAMVWLRQAPNERWAQQIPNSSAARGYLLDLVRP